MDTRRTQPRASIPSRTPTSTLLAVLLLGAAYGTAGAQVTAITGGTLIDGTGAAPVDGAVVVVRGGTIECAGAARTCTVPPDAERVDATGRWVIPGLVDAHVHYSQTGWADGRPDALDLRDRFPYDSTVHWLEENPRTLGRSYLCSGVTATFDVGGYPWTWDLRAWSDSSRSMPHVEAAGPLLSTRDHWVNLPAERQFIHIPTDSAVDVGADYLVANGTSAIKVWFLVGSRSDTAALRARMETTAAHARAAGVPLIVHATGLWDAKVAVANGASLLVHSVEDQPVDDEFLDLARRAGTIYTPTLTVRDGYVQLATRGFDPAPYGDALACVDPETLAKARLTDSLPGGVSGARADAYRERVATGAATMAANLRRVRDAGIPIAMGTDAGNPFTLHGPAVFPEMEAMAAAGMTPTEVLTAATSVAARAMGRLDDFGTVEAGKAADLVVLDADPLADVANVRRIHAVMRAGHLLDRSALEERSSPVSPEMDGGGA
jgi:imidazolonepropionase-like amidohydrolase